MLISQGRQKEARQILDLLKIQEIRDFVGVDNQNRNQVRLNEIEQEILDRNQSLVDLSRQIRECEKTNCGELNQLKKRLAALQTEFDRNLATIEKRIENRIATDINTFSPDSNKAVEIVNSQPNKVMIYPLVMENKLWLLLYSGDAAKRFVVPVTWDELGNTVKEFRQLMEECETRTCGAEDIEKVKVVSQKLYGWLIKPLEAELKQNKVKNLVFALDRVTRYIPMSALYDGNRYLIENYTVYNVLSAELTNTTARLPEKVKNTKVLAMGVSDAIGGFSTLPSVPKEIDGIVKTNNKDTGIYPGEEHLNKSFSYQTLQSKFQNKANNDYSILHIATHGEFIPGKENASYLLLGNAERLGKSKIKSLAGLANTHLVVLSACQTALAGPRQDGVEIASLAYSFVEQGTKSVIASLWQVADNSTSDLMQSFYQNMAKNKQKITKAEAMRLAQLQLIYNKNVNIDDIKRAGGIVPEEIQSIPDKNPVSNNIAHPYYWAPFVLIGNGL